MIRRVFKEKKGFLDLPGARGVFGSTSRMPQRGKPEQLKYRRFLYSVLLLQGG